jgi:hypothetical protein
VGFVPALICEQIAGAFPHMGYHFVPQSHLYRFECPGRPDFVWMYDKKLRVWSQVAIESAAQARRYYDDDVERGLAETIEDPGNRAIKKLLRRVRLNNAERTHLSLHLLTMATRGPRQRRKTLEEIAPIAIAETIKETRAQIEAFGQEPGRAARAEARLRELEAVEAKFSKSTPKQILDHVRTPFWSEETVLCVHNMVWRIVPAPSGRFFLTSDTPTHISEWAGVGTAQSELTFPISKSFALLGSHAAGRPGTIEYLGYLESRDDSDRQNDLVREVNRRMVNCTDRFVFCHRKESWIAAWADSPPPINRIRW